MRNYWFPKHHLASADIYRHATAQNLCELNNSGFSQGQHAVLWFGLCPESLRPTAWAQGAVAILNLKGSSGKGFSHRAAAPPEQLSRKHG